MTYRELHRTNEGYGLVVMWVLIIAFLIAVPFMFVHPSITLALFFTGLIILAVASWVEKLIKRSERVAARAELSAHQCPCCSATIDGDPEQTEELQCQACGSAFSKSGVLLT